ncbi:lytic murein transglycosylase [Roseibium porphyridii]|uniref:Lytic murein transglycosylase n=1 Tax=Roseibium porphyridii TaxID=2866279 RepID=A0ABY8EY02_9HYPH|nr:MULTISPECIES: lytic murein transglycosylase [Stappiaceae]QFT32626.1 Membrane-bound lytic murein transglycosylase B precursor [Labrenzia sp. THAF82]WFE87952.1 lytic murein transglycosylase [Roseibium sp. KMA01]
MNRRAKFASKLALTALTGLCLTTAPSLAQQCGGDFRQFLAGVKQEAVAKGLSANAADKTLAGAQIDRKVLSRDRAQGVFKMTFLDFSKRVISGYRMKNGAANMKKYAAIFQRTEQEYGVPAPVITAFWALETDFGAVQGDFNTVNALATLAHDCRRPELFRPQLIAAIEMVQHGDLDPQRTTGAWAGEIGMVQMLPEDIIKFGKDGNGDGHVRLKQSAEDAILTAGAFIQNLGWRRGEPWLQEVAVPQNLNWAETGLGKTKTGAQWAALGVQPRWGQISGNLPASLLLPQGRKGPAFLAYPNYNIYLEWNQSFIYTTTAAYFATRLAGAPRYTPGNPDPGLNDAQMKQLQTKLQSMGFNVGKIDGILGAGTRAAVQAVQERLGMPADAWPTPALLNRL